MTSSNPPAKTAAPIATAATNCSGRFHLTLAPRPRNRPYYTMLIPSPPVDGPDGSGRQRPKLVSQEEVRAASKNGLAVTRPSQGLEDFTYW